MNKNVTRSLALGLMALFVVCFGGSSVLAQSDVGSSAGQVAASNNGNLDLQFYLLVATNNGSDSGTLPPGFAAVAKDIRSSLQVSQVRLGAIFAHRVENNGRLEVVGIATSSLASPTSNPQYTPTFYNYNIGPIKLNENGAGPALVQLVNLRFGMRLPIQIGGGKAGDQPAINYENVGVTTSISIPLGEPTIVSTLNIGRLDETLVLVVTAKRASPR